MKFSLSDNYVFYILSDAAVSLEVNDVIIIDHFVGDPKAKEGWKGAKMGDEVLSE